MAQKAAQGGRAWGRRNAVCTPAARKGATTRHDPGHAAAIRANRCPAGTGQPRTTDCQPGRHGGQQGARARGCGQHVASSGRHRCRAECHRPSAEHGATGSTRSSDSELAGATRPTDAAPGRRGIARIAGSVCSERDATATCAAGGANVRRLRSTRTNATANGHAGGRKDAERPAPERAAAGHGTAQPNPGAECDSGTRACREKRPPQPQPRPRPATDAPPRDRVLASTTARSTDATPIAAGVVAGRSAREPHRARASAHAHEPHRAPTSASAHAHARAHACPRPLARTIGRGRPPHQHTGAGLERPSGRRPTASDPA